MNRGSMLEKLALFYVHLRCNSSAQDCRASVLGSPMQERATPRT